MGDASPENVSLSLPPRRDYLPALLALAAELAGLAGLDQASREGLDAALMRAGGWMLDMAAQGEGHPVQASFRVSPLGLEARLIDQGPPLHWVEAGLALDDLVAQVRWRNLGRAGNELSLFAPRAHSQTAPPPAPAALAPAPAAPAADWSVRLMRPEDALAVSRAAWSAYGYSYPDPDIYQPERLAALNAAGRLVSAVAVDPGGAVLGHCALLVGDEASGAVGLGKGFVTPRQRRLGCFEALNRFLLAEAARRGFGAAVVHAVADHAVSQRGAARLGFVACGLLPAYAPGLHYRGLGVAEATRVPVVMACLPLGRPWPRPVLPAAHAGMLGAVYDALGCPPAPAESLEKARRPAPLGCGRVSLARSPLTLAAEIRLEEIGQNSAAEARRLWRAARLERVDLITLSLPLGRPGLDEMLSAAGELGFFFAGLWPQPRREDRLILQYLNNLVVDYGRLALAGELGRRIAAYVRAQDPNQPEAAPPACELT